MSEYGGHRILSKKLFAVVVPEAVSPKMLRAEAGVGSRDEVFHPKALNPFRCELRLAEREPDTWEKEERVSNQAAGCLILTNTPVKIMTNSLMDSCAVVESCFIR